MTFTVYAGSGDTTLTNGLLATNSGITIVDGSIVLQASGQDAVNFYDGTLAPLGIGAGLLLTSGTTPGITNTVGWFGTDNSTTTFNNGDADIDAVVNTVFQTQSYDATTLSFDFTVADPSATSVSFDLVFGSDEFPEWVDQFVDCAVVMVNGVNYAYFNHDPLHPLSVVSSNLAAGYFQDNAGNVLPIEYDGVSHVLKIIAPINPGEVNHIKIGIADTGDHIYDSGIFIANLSAGNIPGSGVVSAPTTGTAGIDNLMGTAQAEYFDLKGGDDTCYAGAGDDIVVAGAGDDVVYGGSGADQMKGDAGDDSLDGGDGDDTAVFSDASAGYSVTYIAANNSYTITENSASEGTDTLTNVEFVKFSDGLFTLGPGGLTPVTNPGTPPSNTPGIVYLSGIGGTGQTLTAQVSDANGVSVDGVTYAWQADGAELVGITGNTFLVGAEQVGQNITVTASYTDQAGNAESLTSASKSIAAPGDGDFTITLLNLSAPIGASVMNPLTTLLQNAIDLGVSPNEAGSIIKSALNIDPAVNLLHYDSWAALQANSADAAALAVEKTAVQVAVMTSLGGDETGMALTQAILLAHSNNTTLDLTNEAVILDVLGQVPLDPSDPFDPVNMLVHEIWDRNDTIGAAADVAEIEFIWADIQSGLEVVLSTSIGTLSVHINQAPTGTAMASLGNGVEGTAYTVSAVDLLQGFSDAEGNVLSVSGLAADTGTVTDNGNGTFTITPASAFSGPVELTYNVIDGQGGSAPASQLFVIAPSAPINNAPTGSATATLAAGAEDTAYIVTASDLLAGFSDVDGDTLSVSGLSASNGSVVDNGDGSFTLTPTANFNGPVTLSYNVIDGNGGSFAAAQSYSLAAVNDAPTGSVAITGTSTQGQTLNASNTLVDADGLGTISYQWQADGAVIGGATANSYTLTQAEVGKAITVTASYTDSMGTPESVTSQATGTVLASGMILTGTASANILNGGSGDDILYGLGGNDTLNGFDGNDILNGGAGKDKMAGGAGDDTYYVDSTGDTVTEAIGAGADTVVSSLSAYTLGANVESLILTGTGAINGTGNTLVNTLLGNGAANVLSGLAGNDLLDGGAGNDTLIGGAGNDTLTGGAGADIFRFETVLNASNNRDTILDFASIDDTIQLENGIFTQLKKAGALTASNFSADGTAHDANDYIVYDTDSGALFYDADGSGSGAAIQFATVTLLGQASTITAADFIVT